MKNNPCTDIDEEFELEREKQLEQIDAVRLKFAQTDLSSLKQGTKNPRSRDRDHRSPVEPDEPEQPVKPAKPVKTTYYRSLPTASGLKLDQNAVNTLVEMGFDKANAIQGKFSEF